MDETFDIIDFDDSPLVDFNNDNVVWDDGDHSLIMTSQNNLTPINAIIGITT